MSESAIEVGLAAIQRREFARAIEVLRPLVAEKPSARVHHAYACALAAVNRPQAAAQHFRAALVLHPQATSYEQLARVLQSDGEIVASADAFVQALELDPTRASARLALAGVWLRLGRYDDAKRAIDRVLHEQPNNHVAWIFLAGLHRYRGELKPCIVAGQRALQELRVQGIQVTAQSRPFALGSARAAALKLRESLNAAGLEFWLWAGTLLGVVRDGDLLTYDKDLDFALPWSTPRQAVLSALLAKGHFLPSLSQPQDPELQEWRISVFHRQTRTAIDLFFVKPEGDALLCGVYTRPSPIVSRTSNFGRKPMQWLDLPWLIPDAAERYFGEIYGPNWRTPDPHFDTIVSSFAKLPESIESRWVSGFLRVYRLVSAGKIAQAVSLIDQVQALRSDGFLQSYRGDLLALLAANPEANA